jgi:hypothetical protein
MRDRELTLSFFGLSLLGAVGRAADLKDNFLSISDLDGGAAAGGGTPPVGLWPDLVSASLTYKSSQ